ncbi:MAG: aminotransferase DegT [Bacillota bacterium]|jgi:perosamine synthetase|nr:aminotransferase DegT [Bacillota bacterium]
MNNDLNESKIAEIVRNVLNDGPDYVPLHEPSFHGREWECVKDCLDSGWVSSAGNYVEILERKLEEYTGAAHAISVVNGTAALHLCLRLLGVGMGDEVLMPALTFVATANAVSYCGAIPHLVDSDRKTLGICPEKLADYLKEIAEMKRGACSNSQTGRPIKALLVMHTLGHPADLEPLLEICEKYELLLIEDAAEALGSLYQGKHAGTIGTVSSLSFNGNKIVTTGGGGAVLTNDDELAYRAKHLSTTAKRPHVWEFIHDEIGYNYRMPNLNAALGCAQMEQLDVFIDKKRKLAEKYKEAFRNVEGISFFAEPEYARSNYWLNALVLDHKHAHQRDTLLEILNRQGIGARPLWKLMNELEMYRSCPRMDLSVSEELVQAVINIPSSPDLVNIISNPGLVTTIKTPGLG